MSEAAVLRLPEQAPLRDLAAGLFDELHARTFDGVGITRECYEAGENAAIALFRETADRNGLKTRFDAGAGVLRVGQRRGGRGE